MPEDFGRAAPLVSPLREALSAIELSDRDAAWRLFDALRERGARVVRQLDPNLLGHIDELLRGFKGHAVHCHRGDGSDGQGITLINIGTAGSGRGRVEPLRTSARRSRSRHRTDRDARSRGMLLHGGAVI